MKKKRYFWVLLFVLIFCSFFRISFPIKVTILDIINNQLVPDAFLERTISIDYISPGGPVVTDMQISEGTTGEKGDFEFSAGIYPAIPLISYDFRSRIRALAPGYYLTGVNVSWHSTSTEITLSRIRHYLPLYYYYSRHAYAQDLSDGYIRSEFEDNIKSFSYTPSSPNGVFAIAKTKDVSFDRVLIKDNLIHAIDSKKKKTYVWDEKGIPIDIYENYDFPNSKENDFSLDGIKRLLRLNLKRGTPLLIDEKNATEELLALEKSNIDCINKLGYYGHFVVFATIKGENVIYTLDPHKKALRQRKINSISDNSFDYSAKQIPSEKTKIIVCKEFDRDTLFVAFDGAGIKKYWFSDDILHSEPWIKNNGNNSTEKDINSVSFVDFSFGYILGLNDVVYAVSGDNRIYRFGFDGTPDYIITFE